MFGSHTCSTLPLEGAGESVCSFLAGWESVRLMVAACRSDTRSLWRGAAKGLALQQRPRRRAAPISILPQCPASFALSIRPRRRHRRPPDAPAPMPNVLDQMPLKDMALIAGSEAGMLKWCAEYSTLTCFLFTLFIIYAIGLSHVSGWSHPVPKQSWPYFLYASWCHHGYQNWVRSEEKLDGWSMFSNQKCLGRCEMQQYKC